MLELLKRYELWYVARLDLMVITNIPVISRASAQVYIPNAYYI